MTFSQQTKNMLCSLNVKKRCCKRSLLYGMLKLSGTYTPYRIKLVTENERISALMKGLLHSLIGVESNLYISSKKSGDSEISSYKLTVAARADALKVFTELSDIESDINYSLFECPDCQAHFLRGAFLSGGTVSDPEAGGYHLEISTPEESLAQKVCKLINECGLQSKLTERQNRHAVYIKDSENIEDFLTFIGAQLAAVDMMNAKIMKDIRNYENRISNCEAANIYKTTGSAGEQIKAINILIEKGIFRSLSEDLIETANLRLENPYASLGELAEMHDPPISKSGVNHRLKKIIELSKKV